MIDGSPIRQLSRLGNELHLTASIAVLDLAPGQYERGVVALILLKRCALDWIEDGRLRRPERITRTSSIKALATSLGKPYATVNRHIHHLVADGLCVVTPAGVAISNAVAVEARVVAFLTAAHDSLIRLAGDIGAGLNIAPPARAPSADLIAATVLAALDIWLVPFEYARYPVVDWTSKIVWLVIFVANVRHIVTDPVLSDRYAVEPTPDALRRPITVRAIARVARLSYGTVFRHCRSLMAEDVIRYDRGGWLLVSRQLDHEDVDQGVRALLAYYGKRLGELADKGLNVDDAAAHYLGPPAPYVPV